MMSGNSFGSNLGGFLGGMFGDSGAPYDKAMDQYKKYFDQAKGFQNPFYNAGTGAIPKYQDWLGKMSNPSEFINGLMGQYKESPWAKNQQDQANRAGINAGSASGLSGSTPMMQQMQQNSANISSEDMGKWLQSVLGVNSEYGSGQQSLMQGGQGAANSMSTLMAKLAELMGQGAYGREAGQQQDKWNMIGGGLGLAGNIGSMFL